MITPSQFGFFVTTVTTMIGAVYNSDDVPSVWMSIASEVPITSSQLVLGWTGLMPKMRPWYGPRQPHEPAAQTYTITPIPYENTYAIDRFHLDDDQFGIYYRMLPDMARQAKRQPDYELRDLIENAGVMTGARQLGFDGLTHWNTAHPVNLYDVGVGTYSNDFRGGFVNTDGVTVGGELSPTAFTSAYEYMSTINGEDGERLGVRPRTLMHPTTLRAEVELILKSTFFAPPSWGAWAPIGSQVGAADNPLKRFGVEPLENEFLKSNVNWYLLDTTKAFKPFLWGVREAVKTVPRINENDPAVFDSHVFQWGQWDRVTPAWDYAFLSAISGPAA